MHARAERMARTVSRQLGGPAVVRRDGAAWHVEALIVPVLLDAGDGTVAERRWRIAVPVAAVRLEPGDVVEARGNRYTIDTVDYDDGGIRVGWAR